MPARSRTHSSRQTAATAAPVQPVAPTAPAAGRTFPWPLALGFAALAVGLVALGWTLFASGRGASDCQARAWDSIPEERALPDGWAVTATNFFVGNSTVTLEGPAADTDTGEGVVYATVTCYGDDGSEALARSRAADASTGSPTTDLEGIGDEGYAIEDGTGLSAMHFRRGDLVSYLVVAGNVTPDELRSTATAFDQAMIDAKAGDLPSIAPAGTPGSVDETLPDRTVRAAIRSAARIPGSRRLAGLSRAGTAAAHRDRRHAVHRRELHRRRRLRQRRGQSCRHRRASGARQVPGRSRARRGVRPE